MTSIKDVSDLRVYKLSLEILNKIYFFAYKIPHLKLRTQLINSSEAIAPLIAEGFAKRRNRNTGYWITDLLVWLTSSWGLPKIWAE